LPLKSNPKDLGKGGIVSSQTCASSKPIGLPFEGTAPL
jgi:hypothetical protein